MYFPEILKKSISLLNCIDIDNEHFIEVVNLSPDIQCWSETHFNYVFKYSLPGMIFWGIITPFFALKLLYSNSESIKHIINQRKRLFSEKITQSKVTISTSNVLRTDLDSNTDISNNANIIILGLPKLDSIVLDMSHEGNAQVLKFLYRDYRDKY